MFENEKRLIMFENETRRYVGGSPNLNKQLDEQNKARDLEKWLSKFDWSEIDYETMKKIVSVLDDEYECEKCIEHEEKIETTKEEFQNFAYDIRYDIVRAIAYQIELYNENKENKEEQEYAIERIQEIITRDYDNVKKKYKIEDK